MVKLTLSLTDQNNNGVYHPGQTLHGDILTMNSLFIDFP